MSRAEVYEADENGPYTFDFDESLPAYPLPELHDTLQRYYESLKPFGTPVQLENSRAVIAQFENGIGAQLQQKLKARAASMKNWLDEWWEKYAYHSLRMPLNPYTVMATSLRVGLVGLIESREHAQKNLARVLYHTIEHWDLVRKAKLKPMSSNQGRVKNSSALYKRFFSTTRVPGVEYDHIKQYFKTVDEGVTPTHGLICGKGRMFTFNIVHEDGSLITAPELLILVQRMRSMLDYEPMGDCAPILTHDERTSWAKNYMHLLEISNKNREAIEIIQSAAVVAVMDEHEPLDYEEVSQYSLYGDLHSRWGDRTSIVVSYKNGRFACVGEHSAYDGTVSISYMFYVQLSILEAPEPDWLTQSEQHKPVHLEEIKLQLDDKLQSEIQRLHAEFKIRGHDVIVSHIVFDDYGKDYMKNHKLHPDSFIQVVMQWTYTRLHNEVASTYETALMRHYYKGRTETLRSCTSVVNEFLKLVQKPGTVNKKLFVRAFRDAVEHHNHMMNEARQGKGIDRHLFGLWCMAYESGIEIPSFFDDPLYAKSGGGGNFVLSTSTLGYTVNLGFVAPMLLDGYSVFYSITSNALFIKALCYRASQKTSAHRFNDMFADTFRLAKDLLESDIKSNL